MESPATRGPYDGAVVPDGGCAVGMLDSRAIRRPECVPQGLKRVCENWKETVVSTPRRSGENAAQIFDRSVRPTKVVP
jgi:hypothetical protein